MKTQTKRAFSLLLPLFAASLLHAQQPDTQLYQSLKWRSIGPFRAGRVSAVAGIAGNAAVYYMGSPGGGVWKTVDGGVVWNPIMDKIPVASIGAIVVAPSNPDVVYVGTGDVSMVGAAVNMGNGVYKSTDAGRSWTHAGLDGTEHIGTMWVDPKNPDVVVVAALGKTFARDSERGIFKTIDGGRTWRKTLYKDDETGAIDVAFSVEDTKVGYAALWHHLVQPGETNDLINGSKGGAIYKTTDGGDSWAPVGAAGLPKGRMSRIGVATAKGGNLVVAIIAGQGMGGGGFYRSDDGGTTWNKATADTRVTGSGYFSRVFLDPGNPDVIYVAQTSLYRSEDGGKTFISFKGAPGGDDNHALWIDPTDSSRMIMASDQGATISMDRGLSWSSWYNQPTAQVYHMSTDHRWPYWVYGTQQDSGSVATLSRGDYGAITMLDWDPVAAYEFGYIVPSPLDPNMVFAGGPGRGIVLLNRVNRQVQTISPSLGRDSDFRTAQNPPLGFSPQDPHVFYMANQYLMETRDNGSHWKKASPDLTERQGSAIVNADERQIAADAAVAGERQARTREASETLTPPNRSAINTFSLSPVKAGEIWVGTTNGLLQLTFDGGAGWQTVSPPGLSQFAMVSMTEASHFDAATAYISVDRHEENDFKPHIYITHDSGKTWVEGVSGIAPGDFVRVVREDPKCKGLLYAGTENKTYVSFDEGGHWHVLQLNMPTTSVRDLQIEGNDLVAATYGRSFWILDDVSPLRQIGVISETKAAHPETFLYQPGKAIRVQLDLNGDTPIPPELPAGQNPPNGALIDFYLKSAPAQDISLAIYDQAGKLVREFSTRPEEHVAEPPPSVPDYWLGHPEPLTKVAGENRFVWDLRYAPPDALRHQYAISAMYAGTPGDPLGALVVPSTYEVRLTVGGEIFKRPLDVVLDPRVNTSQKALERQLALELNATDMTSATYALYHRAMILREAVAGDQKKLQDADAIAALKDFDAKVVRIAGAEGGRGGGPPGAGRARPTLTALNGEFGSLATVVDSADTEPTPAMQTAFSNYCRALTTVSDDWNDLLLHDLPALNDRLAAQKLSALPAAAITMQSPCRSTAETSVSAK
jgi:photosystem II stability/assembly factor-like uncharacterized protein